MKVYQDLVKNVLESQDVFSTIKCLKQLGVKIKKISPKKFKIHGKGLGSLFAKKNTLLNFGNSGTLARLLIGMLSTTPALKINLTGDHSLKKRSMKVDVINFDSDLDLYEIQSKIEFNLNNNDLILIMGAGTISKLPQYLKNAWQ